MDTALAQRYPDALTNDELPSQPRWRWYARSCHIKHGVPTVLLIEADMGYLLFVSSHADTIFEFGLDLIDALMTSLGIHPEIHAKPDEALFSFEQNPERICWLTGSADNLVLKRRLNEASTLLATMSPAQGHKALAELNHQSLNLAVGGIVPNDVMQKRLRNYAELWLRYSERTSFVKTAWNAWRKLKPWLEGVDATGEAAVDAVKGET